MDNTYNETFFDDDFGMITDKDGNEFLVNDNQDIDNLEYLDNLAQAQTED